MIADDLRKSNIAEYLLHMWQMESLVRAYNRDIDRIDADIISKMPEQERAAARDWFENIIKINNFNPKTLSFVKFASSIFAT